MRRVLLATGVGLFGLCASADALTLQGKDSVSVSKAAAEEKQHDAALRKFEKDSIDAATDDRIARRNCRSDAKCERSEEEKYTWRVMQIQNAQDRENARHEKVLIDLRPPA